MPQASLASVPLGDAAQPEAHTSTQPQQQEQQQQSIEDAEFAAAIAASLQDDPSGTLACFLCRPLYN